MDIALVLKWLPVFGGILGGTVLFAGIAMGVYHACWQILGSSQARVWGYAQEGVPGIVPLAILEIGAYSAFGGLRSRILVQTMISVEEGQGHVAREFHRIQMNMRFLSGAAVGSAALLILLFAVPGLVPLWIRLRSRTTICPHCLRYTHPDRSHYEGRTRSCEHCSGIVKLVEESGNVTVILGDFRLGAIENHYRLSNHDFEQQHEPIDVSEVYLHTKTSNRYLIEKFLTYIVNHPPEHGIQSVQIFYKGDLDDLGEHLANALQNTFTQIKHLS